jgi:hypothetical protein
MTTDQPSEAARPLPHDQRIALCNHIMRTLVAPALPEPERACLLVFPAGAPGPCVYMANAYRSDMRKVLRELLAKWDADAAARGEP